MNLEIQNTIKAFIAHDILQGQDNGLDLKSPLLELGIIESMNMAALLTFIESHFSVTVPGDKVSPENFKNIEAIASLVGSLNPRVP